MRPYSMDLRERVIAACDAGQDTSEVAEEFGVSPAWVRRLKQRLRETGSLAPKPHGGGQKPILDEQGRAKLAGLLREQSDLTLEELRKRLGIKISIGALWNAIHGLGLSLKKSPCMPQNRTGPT